MQRRRVASVIALLGGLFAAPAGYTADAPSGDLAKSFEVQIAQFDGQDSRAPQALEAHLHYAAYLSDETGEGCGARLAVARSHLQAVQKNVALAVVLPQGLARAADVEYRLHTALAACGEAIDASHRDAELRAALKSARSAAALYEQTFDYPAMLTMQFNAAVTQQALGDSAAGRAALQLVIDADRTYGFRDDAEENYRLLLGWSHTDDRQIATLMQDFPSRKTTLNFAWIPGKNTVSLKSQSDRIVGDKVVSGTGNRTVTRNVLKQHRGWTVAYQPLDSHYSFGPLDARTSVGSSFLTALGTMLLQFHDFSLKDARADAAGVSADFSGTVDDHDFKTRVEKDDQTYLQAALSARLKSFLRPSAVYANAALDHNLETGAWSGAEMKQGQWYGMNLMLPLPFAPLNFVAYQVQFAFTREVPCNEASNRSCVEIVLRAIPDETELNNVMRQLQNPLHLRHDKTVQARSTTYMRLITDPSTLQAYHRDMRQFFYVWVDGAANDSRLEPLLGSDQTTIDSSVITPAAE